MRTRILENEHVILVCSNVVKEIGKGSESKTSCVAERKKRWRGFEGGTAWGKKRIDSIPK